ncbi:MAG TPA: tetratricopeptide repeat protein [Polyangia bacterium]|nr:tetratricopeptide repeat protein [Polyangia bacterium]
MGRARAWLSCLIAASGCGTTAPPTTRATWTPAELAAQAGCESGDIRACGALGRSLVRAARDMRDVERGLVLLEGACGRDDLTACAALGDWYRVQDDDRHHGRATALLTRACDGNVGDGCRALGEAAVDQRDWAGALLLFDRACELGDAEGCEKAGVFGRKFENRSEERAEASFQRACALGRHSSCYRLGMMYLHRPSTAPDGAALLARACTRGYAPSCLPAAAAFAPVIGLQPACGAAGPLAQQACASGVNDGCVIGDACALEVGRDRPRALSRLREACDHGISIGCFYWADAQSPQTGAEVATAYEATCQAHSAAAPTACARLAVMALQRAVSSADTEVPLAALRDLCSESVTAACCALADVYTAGRLVPPDPAQAAQFRRPTCPPAPR